MKKIAAIFFTSRTSVCISNSSKYFKSKIDRPIDQYKVHIFWEGHKILQNLHLTFDFKYWSQKWGEDFAKFCTTAWIPPHGYCCMDTAAWIPPHGYRCMDTAAWIPLHWYPCMDDAWIPPHGYRRVDTAAWIPLHWYRCIDKKGLSW